MFAVHVNFIVRIDKMAEFLPLMRKQAANSLALERECHQFDVWRDPARPEQVMLYELYTDAAAFDHHLASDHFKSFAAAVEPLIMNREIVTWSIQEEIDG